jgi:hypothetical protein
VVYPMDLLDRKPVFHCGIFQLAHMANTAAVRLDLKTTANAGWPW